MTRRPDPTRATIPQAPTTVPKTIRALSEFGIRKSPVSPHVRRDSQARPISAAPVQMLITATSINKAVSGANQGPSFIEIAKGRVVISAFLSLCELTKARKTNRIPRRIWVAAMPNAYKVDNPDVSGTNPARFRLRCNLRLPMRTTTPAMRRSPPNTANIIWSSHSLFRIRSRCRHPDPSSCDRDSVRDKRDCHCRGRNDTSGIHPSCPTFPVPAIAKAVGAVRCDCKRQRC